MSRLLLRSKLIRILTLLAVVASLVPASVTSAQQTDPNGGQETFDETGFTVRYPFYAYFIQHGGVEQFGYPISSDFSDPRTGLLVQYFQKARLEYHPENAAPYDIQLGLLGDEIAVATNKKQAHLPVNESPLATDPSCYYFQETGQKVCYSFLDFYRDRGGLDMFGYPVSGYVNESGMTVQYFQRARFEWHPEKPGGQRVQTASIGKIYCDLFRVCSGGGSGGSSSLPPSIKPTRLSARASVMSAITHRGGTQTGYVTVTDQLGNALSGASVTLVVNYPTGTQTYNLPPTNASGITFQTFPVGNVKAGQMVVMVFYITYTGGLSITTRTSYLMWYY